jgi:hypothetical protein
MLNYLEIYAFRANMHAGFSFPINILAKHSKLGRVFDLNCCSSELHKQPGERDNPVPAKARPM